MTGDAVDEFLTYEPKPALNEAPDMEPDPLIDPAAYEAARRQLVPTLSDVRCSARGEWPARKSPGVVIEALSRYPHDTRRIDCGPNAGYDAGANDDSGAYDEPADVTRANVITSRINAGPLEGLHTIAIDLDVPARLVPSSTPGHSHLYIDRPLSWDAYARLLDALAAAGVIEDGYAAASKDRRCTRLRLPWIAKRKEPASNGH